jgi:hypothetical protein
MGAETKTYTLKFEYSHKIGDKVHHNTKDGDEGVVTDICYSTYSNRVKYCVVFGRLSDDEVLCTEFELSKSKVF